MDTSISNAPVLDTTLLAFSLAPLPSTRVEQTPATTSRFSPRSATLSPPCSSRSWLPGLLSGDGPPLSDDTHKSSGQPEGDTKDDDGFAWRKRLHTKADGIEDGDSNLVDDGTGVAQYRRACENHGILPSLAVLSSLQRTNIEFSHYLLGEHGGFALACALLVNSQLTSLRLRFAALGNAAAMALVQALRRNAKARVQKLDLEGNSLGPEVGPALAELLSGDTRLRVLSLGHNPLRNLGCQKLFKALSESNSTLVELDLEGTALGDPAGPAIAECLRQNTALKKLNLASNAVTHAWGIVAEGLADNASLQVLDVSSSIIEGEGGRAFCAALGRNTCLKTLDLTDCRLDQGSLDALATALTECRTLETLVMDATAARGLMQAFAANKSSCKIAFRKSAHSRAGEEDIAVDFDGEVDASFDVEPSRKLNRNADGSIRLTEQEAAKLQAELSAAVQSVTTGADPPGKESTLSSQGDGLTQQGVGAVGASQAPSDRTEVGITDNSKYLPDGKSESLMDRALQRSVRSNATDQRTQDSEKAAQRLPLSDAPNQRDPPADGSEGRERGLSELGAILQGTRLQELREVHERAQTRARENPKDLDALQEAAEAASKLSLHNEAALSYLRACSFSLDAAARQGFQKVMELLLVERDRYAPPMRTLYLKVKNLDSTPLLARASSAFSLIPELEAVLDNLHDLLARGGDPEQAKARLRLIVRDTEDELRDVFGFYARGGAADEGKSSESDHMALRYFWRFARDCKLLTRPLPLCEMDRVSARCQPEGVRETANLDPHNGSAAFTALSFPGFVETMCRLSWVLHPGFRTLPEKFDQCVRQQVRPLARKDSRDAMQKQVSISGGGPYVDKHRLRLLKIFRHYCTDFADAMAEAHVAPQESDRSASGRGANERVRPMHGIPVFDRDAKGAPHSGPASGSGQHSPAGGTTPRSRFGKAGGGSGSPRGAAGRSAELAANALNPAHERKVHLSKSSEGGLSQGLDASKGAGKKGLPLTSAEPVSVGTMEEGPGYMTFNDLMRLAERMGIYSPQLNVNKVKSVVEKLICFPDLMPQQHMHNLRSRIIFEEFVEVLARFAVATHSGSETAAARLHKDAEGGWKMLEEFLEEKIYPMAKKVLPGRL